MGAVLVKVLPVEGLRDPPQLAETSLLHDPQAVDGKISGCIRDELEKIPILRPAAHQGAVAVAAIEIAHHMPHPLGDGAAHFSRPDDSPLGAKIAVGCEATWLPRQELQARLDKLRGEQVVMRKQHEKLARRLAQHITAVGHPSQPHRGREDADLRMVAERIKGGCRVGTVVGNDDLDVVHRLAERGTDGGRNEGFAAIRGDADRHQRLMACDGGHASKLREAFIHAFHRAARGGNILARFN